MLLLISVSVVCFFGDQPVTFIAAYIPIVIIALLTTYFIFEKKTREKRKTIRILKYQKEIAKILSVNYSQNMLILQLQIQNAKHNYISSTIINKPNQIQSAKYTKNKSIEVYVNPKNQHDIAIPDLYGRQAPKPLIDYFAVVFFPVLSFCFAIPFLFIIISESDRIFQDSAFIKTINNQGSIWEIYFKSPKKTFINIYNPFKNEKIITIKNKRDKELNKHTNFFISQQKQNVFVIGTGNTPVFDVYNANSYEKTTDIKAFEQSHKILNKGIATIERSQFFRKFIKDGVIKISTNDKKVCYFNITQNKLYNSEKEIQKYFDQMDSAYINKHPYSFVLPYIPNSSNKFQLYKIETMNNKGINELIKLAGDNSISVDSIKENNKNFCKFNPLLAFYDYFTEAKIIYFDSSLVVIEHITDINKDREEIISGFDINRKKLFAIEQKEYPNISKMKEDKYFHNYSKKPKTERDNDKLIIIFEKYGALCINLGSGNILWKYKPVL